MEESGGEKRHGVMFGEGPCVTVRRRAVKEINSKRYCRGVTRTSEEWNINAVSGITTSSA